MPPHPSIVDPPVGFVHRQFDDADEDQQVTQFAASVPQRAAGVAARVWTSADRVAVLHERPRVGGRLRPKRIDQLDASALPDGPVTLRQHYSSGSGELHLALMIDDADVVPEVIATAREHVGAEEHLWLIHEDREALASCRDLTKDAKLLHSARLDRLDTGPERHAAHLRALRLDGAVLHESDWTPGMVALYHRFELLAMAADAQHERVLDGLYEAGIDAVVSEHSEGLIAWANRY